MLNGKIKHYDASAIATICNTMIKVEKQIETEKEIEELKELLKDILKEEDPKLKVVK